VSENIKKLFIDLRIVHNNKLYWQVVIVKIKTLILAVL